MGSRTETLRPMRDLLVRLGDLCNDHLVLRSEAGAEVQQLDDVEVSLQAGWAVD